MGKAKKAISVANKEKRNTDFPVLSVEKISRDPCKNENHSSSAAGIPNVAAGHEAPPSVGGAQKGPLAHHNNDPSHQAYDVKMSFSDLREKLKSIYSEIYEKERECSELTKELSSVGYNSRNTKWQKLIDSCQILLNKYRDFLVTSQHPSASPDMKKLADKHKIPVRMWKHGIFNLWELLWARRPGSLEPLLSFIDVAYEIMFFLSTTDLPFKATWMECVGDLARIRMRIESDKGVREEWEKTSRYWLSKVSEELPTEGRLYHHLAILARPNALQQIYYYSKSLWVSNPFCSARESIMTVFDPVFNGNADRLPEIEAAFVLVYGILFTGKREDQLGPSSTRFFSLLNDHMTEAKWRWSELGQVLRCLLLECGSDSNMLMGAIVQPPEKTDSLIGNSAITESVPAERLEKAMEFSMKIHRIVLRRFGENNTLAFLHTSFMFIAHMVERPEAIACIEDRFPWNLGASMLNGIIQSGNIKPNLEFAYHLENGRCRPLPEEFAMQGLVYVKDYFPEGYFSNNKLEEHEKCLELPWMANVRGQRLLNLGLVIAETGKWLVWDRESLKFGVNPKYRNKLNSYLKSKL